MLIVVTRQTKADPVGFAFMTKRDAWYLVKSWTVDTEWSGERSKVVGVTRKSKHGLKTEQAVARWVGKEKQIMDTPHGTPQHHRGVALRGDRGRRKAA